MYTSGKIVDLLTRRFTNSVEIFPPRNGVDPTSFLRMVKVLSQLELDYISITKGAMGSPRGGTIPIGYMIAERFNVNALVHFRCRDLTKVEVENLLVDHIYFNIKNILAVMGDPNPGANQEVLDPDTHHVNAASLVRQIRDMNKGLYLPANPGDGPRDGMATDFCIGVAAYPERSDQNLEMRIMQSKVEAGAEFAITQMLFNAETYKVYMERLKGNGINIPIIPGIRPVTSPKQVEAAESIFGANVPERLKENISNAKTKEERISICIDFSVSLCSELRAAGAPGVHHFILNDVDTFKRILWQQRKF